MKFLIASAGAKNPSIRSKLVELLGMPIEQADALWIPTAAHALSNGPHMTWLDTQPGQEAPLTELPWKSLGVLELAALPSLQSDAWKRHVEQADVLMAAGGDALYLAHWMRESGLADMLPSLDSVWTGVSAGSMVMTPRIGREFVGWLPPGPDGALPPDDASADDRALGMVDFAIFPHLDNPDLPWNTLEAAERWAARLDVPAYAIDDETAIAVVDGRAEVVSEGQWHRLRS